MRLLHIIDNIDALGGAQKSMVMLAEQLTTASPGDDRGDGADDRRDHTLIVASLTDEDGTGPLTGRLASMGIEVHHFGGARLWSPARLARLVRFLRSTPVDVVQCHLVYANIVGTVAARLAGRPVIASIRNTYVATSRGDRWRQRLEGLVTARLATAIMAVGPETAAARSAQIGRPVLPVPTPVVLPPAATADQRRAARAELGLADDDVLILALGRLAHQKAHDDLIDAFALVAAQHPTARLAIAGSGPLNGELTARIERAGLGRLVQLLGRRSDVDSLLAGADLLANPSRWEGLPNAVLEAMAAGVPVVATTVGDTATIVGAEGGRLVASGQIEELASALAELVADADLRAELGRRARTRVAERHDPTRWATHMIELAAATVEGRADSLPAAR